VRITSWDVPIPTVEGLAANVPLNARTDAGPNDCAKRAPQTTSAASFASREPAADNRQPAPRPKKRPRRV